MDLTFLASATSGFVFPNDSHIHWTVMIVIYPLITGLVSGSFLLSALYFVFDKEEFKPVARFSMVASFMFLLFAPLPLMNHLGQPTRGYMMLVTPNFGSAMAGFGYIYLILLTILVLSVWFEFRTDFAKRAEKGGFLGKLLKLALLYQTDQSPETREVDIKMVRILMAIGIPLACLLGYVGFLFGSVKANPWWSTPMMFMIFLLSSVVSGFAIVTFLYITVCTIRRRTANHLCVQSLSRYLWGFMIIAVSTELLEILTIAYEQSREWHMLYILITEKLFISFIVIQIAIGSGIPFVLLGINALVNLKRKIAIPLIWVSCGLLVIQVMSMRWNVVIGGQLLSKSHRGFTSYTPELFAKEGLVVAAIIVTVPFLLMYLFDKVIPLLPQRKRRQQPAA